MTIKFERFARRAIMPICVAVLSSCARNAAPPSYKSEKFSAENEPEFVIGGFHVLGKAQKNPSLPTLVTQDGRVNENCYKVRGKPSTWKTDNQRTARLLEKNERSVTAAVLAWLAADIFPNEKELFADPSFWKVEVSTPVVRHVYPSEIALKDDQTCIDEQTRDFPLGAQTATTFFGAGEMTFKSSSPVLSSRIRALRQAALKKKLRVIVKNAYTPALDENGKQRRGPKRKKLFNSPTGALIAQRDIPPPKLRKTTQWKIVLPKPVFFAAGFLPNGSWKKENLPDACEVYLVYNEAVPHVPACSEFNAAGFGVERAEEQGHVLIKAASADKTFVKDAEFGKVTAMTTGNAAIWITPIQAEEGAHLKIDSLVLDTGAPTPKITSFPAGGKKAKKASKHAKHKRRGK